MAEDDPEVVALALKILARLLTFHGPVYVKKFAEKTGGFVVMRHRLKRWWNLPSLWPMLFAIMFDYDVAKIDFNKDLDHFGLLELFGSPSKLQAVYPEVLPVIASMLQRGLKEVCKDRPNESPSTPTESNGKLNVERPKHSRKRSMSLGMEFVTSCKAPFNSSFIPLLLIVPAQSDSTDHQIEEKVTLLNTISQFLTDVHSKSSRFRDFAATSTFVQELLFILFPVVVSSDMVSADSELHPPSSGLSFNGSDVPIRPLAHISSQAPPIVRTTNVEIPSSPSPHRLSNLRRGSSFVLVSSEPSQFSPSTARLHHAISPKETPRLEFARTNSVVQGYLELAIVVFSDVLFDRKDFPGFGIFLKVPPGFQEHQVYFQSYVLRNTLSHLGNAIHLDQNLLLEPRVITNLARFVTHLGEAIYEGWFLEGAETVLDFAGSILEYLQRPDIAKAKSVRLCSQAIGLIRAGVFRIVLLRLSEVDDRLSEQAVTTFMNKLTYWQTILLSSEDTQGDYLRLMCYLLYIKLICPQEQVRLLAANLWRILLVQKPDETSVILNYAAKANDRQLASGFRKLVELDNETFLYWVDTQRENLDAFFFGAMSRSWEAFVDQENRRTEETASNRMAKRKERLKQWVHEDLMNEDVIRRHETALHYWTTNIYKAENTKHQRAVQDYQDNLAFTVTCFDKMMRDLRRPTGLLEDQAPIRWRLDQTEGRNRMRLRVLPDNIAHLHNYKPKRKATRSTPVKGRLSINTQGEQLSGTNIIDATPTDVQKDSSALGNSRSVPPVTGDGEERDPFNEDEFEMIDAPGAQDAFEDRNRKVMRSLERNDQVQHVTNIARIVGLEAVEGLLILGKNCFYLIDNFFQRPDGEIVNVWQAPEEERDAYLRMISGHESKGRPAAGGAERKTRSWKWEEIISISKRRFLFRDVAIEIFFADGRSYLLTIMSPKLRDDLYARLSAKATPVTPGQSPTSFENAWRYEALKSPDDTQQTFGSKFANVFGQAFSNPATRKWIKGEMSNFHYLMLINTMAGRTFNDLTQYPVFPWVIADYTSDELDLTDPRSFRDLSKPMGAQTLEREAEFRDRYQSFAEMGDHNSPPFHYGTHYSSAMIVSSYLIRLQPFVQSYLLLQGGSFDHADRLFYSVPKAWLSASSENMTDVRELIPEFFFLPEFLNNTNGYDFGLRQGVGGNIDNVVLPPWAKGDPKVFISKNREALESPYVSQNLHRWIDLVFGFKQRGEAAFEATNVFHHLSYHGAKDLDTIEDPVERLATIGIIHNFGQTPHQVFQRSHPQREDVKHPGKRLDIDAQELVRLPSTLMESGEPVAALSHSSKTDRLLCSAAFRLNIPPVYDKYMEWGFADGSIRFYSAESKRMLGHFEHLHIGQLSSAIFADSRTLITSGTDCTMSIWSVMSDSKSMDLQPKGCLFGHRTPVNVLAVSRSFSALLSASKDGQVLLWDLNRLEFVLELTKGAPVDCARINDVTGNILVCRGNRAAVYTLNGALLLDQAVCERNDDGVACCAFYEGQGNEWLDRDLIFTGHRRGVVNVRLHVLLSFLPPD